MPEKITTSFLNSRGLRLSALIDLPDGQASETWAVLSHGMLSTKDSRKHGQLANMFANLGIPALRFDFSGQGESEGQEEVITYSNGIDDLSCALQMAKEKGAKRFILTGSSMGSGVSMLVASQTEEDIIGLALIASVVKTGMIWDAMNEEQRNSWRESGEFDFHGRSVSFDTVTDGKLHDLEGALKKITAPILFVHGKKDELIDFNLLNDFSKLHPGEHEINFIDGADHRLSNDNPRQQALESIITWVKEKLI